MILILLFTFVFANNSTIEGTIVDIKSNKPLFGANIMLEGTNLGSASQDNGIYTITNIPIGTYTLRAMFIGYENFEKNNANNEVSRNQNTKAFCLRSVGCRIHDILHDEFSSKRSHSISNLLNLRPEEKIRFE